MAFDACMMYAVIREIKEAFPEGKVEKVLQPQGDEIDLVMRARGINRRIVLNVGANAPRLQISDTVKENPLKAPMFCMLLRKRLTGAKLLRVEQPGFDRVAVFVFSSYDEMGFSAQCRLVCEIMGKYANLIFVGSDEKIVSALKLIDFADSTVRQVLPGMLYRLPPAQDKQCPLCVDAAFFMRKWAEFEPERTVEKFITTVWGGIATQIAHELCYRASGACDVVLSQASPERMYEVFSAWQNLLLSGDFTPTIAFDAQGKARDCSYMPISYTAESCETYSTLGAMFDVYFEKRDRAEKMHQRAHDILTLLNNAEHRTRKKLALQRETLAQCAHAQEYRQQGDLITANIYRIRRGDTELVAPDYTKEDGSMVRIPLDARLSPAQNAQKMYKLYNKAKNARAVLTECIAQWEAELLYLDSVRDFLTRASSEEDIAQIRDELYRSGYASRMKGYQPPRRLLSKPLEMRTSGGYRVLVGRNNVQNDQLTFRVATKGDIWFHVKDMPGSHVILLCDGEEPPAKDYTEAASIAAYHSKASADRVAVDYTRVKNVHKPQGAKPGYVTYKNNFTAYVRPAADVQSVGMQEKT